MASAFNLTAELNLRGPTNVRQVVSQIRKQIGTIDATVNVKVNANTTRNVTQLNASLVALNKNLKNVKGSASAAARAMQQFSQAAGGRSVGQASQQINQVTQSLSNVSSSTGNAARNLKVATSQMEEFGKQSALAVRRFAAFSLVTTGIYALNNALVRGISSFIDYNKEIIRLQQVTGDGANAIGKLEARISNLATSLGVSSSELTKISVTLAQAGLRSREASQALDALAKSALAPTFDDLNRTVEGSIALMRQFGIGADQLESALGSINAVSAKFAVEAGDIIGAVQRAGGVFASSSKGVSQGIDALQEFIAVFTSVRATTRESAETISTGLRTIFTRLQRESTITALKEFGVNLQDTEGKFVGVYKAVELLSKGLGGLDPRDIRFSKIVEELGGFRQIGKVIPLLQQFTTAQNALSVAQRGQGSLAKDAALAQLSLANQISKVREEFLSLVREIGATDSFQVLVKGALSVSSAMISIADSVKGLIPILGSVLAFKGIGALGNFAKGFGGGLRRNAAGGAIQKYARGGVVGGSGSGDTVPAMLEPGEFVIRKKAVQAVGMQNLSRMNRYSYGGPISFKKVTGARQGGKSLASRLSTTKKDAYKQGALINEGDIFSQQINEKEFTSKSIGAFLKRKKGAAFTIRKLADSNQNVRGAEFENFIQSYVAGAGTRTTGNAPLDFVGPPGEAKFQKKGVPYQDLVAKSLRQRIDSGKFSSLRDSKGGAPSESVQSFDNIYAPGVNLFKLEGDFDSKIARDAAGLNKKKKAETEKNKQKNRSSRNYFGGTIRRFATGGSSEDTVPALLTPGEFVVNKKAAKSLGAAKLNNLNRADRVKGYNKGGFVGVQKFNTGGGVDPEIDKFATQSLKQGSATGPSIDLQKLEKSITGIGKATTLTTGRLQKYATTLSVSGDLLNDVAGRLGKNNTQFDLLRQKANGAALSFEQVESAIMGDIQALKRQGASLIEVQQKEDALARLRDTKSAATNRLVEQRSAILSNTIVNSVKRAGDRISSIPLVGGFGKGLANVGRGISGQAGFFAGSAISMLGGAGESIFGDREGSEANARNVTGFERATTQAGTGLAIAGQVAMIPGIGPAAAGVIALGTAAYATLDYFRDFSGAQEEAARELRKSKAADALDKATKGVSRALGKFEADLNNVDLESRLVSALGAQNTALAAAASTSFEETFVKNRQEGIADRSYFEFFAGAQPEMLGGPELKEFAATQAAAARESAVAAQQVMLQQMRRGETVSSDVERTIARTDQSAQLQMAIAYNKALEEGKSEAEARAAGEAALTKAIAAGGIEAVEAAKKQSAMTIKMEEAAKATARLAFSLEKLIQAVSDGVGRFMFETGKARNARSVRADRLAGKASMQDTSFDATNILQNPGSYNQKDIANAVGLASSFIPGEAGRTARNQGIAGSFIQRNPNLTVDSVVSSTGGAGLSGEEIADRLTKRQKVASSKIKDPEQQKAFDDTMTTAIAAGQAAAAAEKDKTPEGQRQAFDKAFNESLRQQQEKAAEPLIQILQALEAELNAFSKEVQASGQRLEEARRFRQKADDVGTDFELSLRKVMTGVDASFGETALISARRTGRDTGGRTDPFAILQNIENLNKESEDLERKRAAVKGKDSDAFAKHTLELDENNRELARNKAALEKLASSGELAAAALRELSEIRALQDQTINQAKGILTRSPEENLRNFRADQRLAQFQQTGRLESNTPEARAAARDAFQRSGGDPRQARLAFENVRAQQRGEVLSALDRQRASRELNKRNERADFILKRREKLGITGPLTAEQRAQEQQELKDKGLTDEQIRTDFNKEQANLMRQMGAQMGLTPQNAPEFFRAIERLEDPKTDKAAQLAEREAKDAALLQQKANEAMAQLNENMANLPAVLESLSASIANLETYLASEGRGTNIPPIRQPIPPGTKAQGGIIKPIYAQDGTYVEYKPQGKDKIPTMLAEGEYVLKDSAVSQIGVRNLDILNKTGSLSQAMYGNKGGLIKAKGFVRGGLAMMDFDNDPQGKGIIGQTNNRAKQMASAESERHFAETGDREAANQIYKDSYSKYGGYDMSKRIDPEEVYNSNNEYRNSMLQSSEERRMHNEEMQAHKEDMAISRDQLRMADTAEHKEHHKRNLTESRQNYMRLEEEGPRTTAYDEMFTPEARKAREEQANKDYLAGVNFAKTQAEKQKEAERIKTEQAADAANDARLAQATTDYNQAQAERKAREQNAIKQGFIQPDQISDVQTFYTDGGHSRHGSFHKYDPETGMIHFDTRDPQTLEITGSATVPFDRLDKDSYRRVYEQYEKQQERLALEQYYRDEERKRQEAQMREGVGQMMEMLPSVPGMMYDNFIQKPMDAGAQIYENMKQTAAAQEAAKAEKEAKEKADRQQSLTNLENRNRTSLSQSAATAGARIRQQRADTATSRQEQLDVLNAEMEAREFLQGPQQQAAPIGHEEHVPQGMMSYFQEGLLQLESGAYSGAKGLLPLGAGVLSGTLTSTATPFVGVPVGVAASYATGRAQENYLNYLMPEFNEYMNQRMAERQIAALGGSVLTGGLARSGGNLSRLGGMLRGTMSNRVASVTMGAGISTAMHAFHGGEFNDEYFNQLMREGVVDFLLPGAPDKKNPSMAARGKKFTNDLVQDSKTKANQRADAQKVETQRVKKILTNASNSGMSNQEIQNHLHNAKEAPLNTNLRTKQIKSLEKTRSIGFPAGNAQALTSWLQNNMGLDRGSALAVADTAIRSGRPIAHIKKLYSDPLRNMRVDTINNNRRGLARPGRELGTPTSRKDSSVDTRTEDLINFRSDGNRSLDGMASPYTRVEGFPLGGTIYDQLDVTTGLPRSVQSTESYRVYSTVLAGERPTLSPPEATAITGPMKPIKDRKAESKAVQDFFNTDNSPVVNATQSAATTVKTKATNTYQNIRGVHSSTTPPKPGATTSSLRRQKPTASPPPSSSSSLRQTGAGFDPKDGTATFIPNPNSPDPPSNQITTPPPFISDAEVENYLRLTRQPTQQTPSKPIKTPPKPVPQNQKDLAASARHDAYFDRIGVLDMNRRLVKGGIDPVNKDAYIQGLKNPPKTVKDAFDMLMTVSDNRGAIARHMKEVFGKGNLGFGEEGNFNLRPRYKDQEEQIAKYIYSSLLQPGATTRHGIPTTVFGMGPRDMDFTIEPKFFQAGHYNKGGMVYGNNKIKPKGTDTIMANIANSNMNAALSPEEFVVRAPQARKFGGLLNDINNGKLQSSNMTRYLSQGGFIKPGYYNTGGAVAGVSNNIAQPNISIDTAALDNLANQLTGLQEFVGQLGEHINTFAQGTETFAGSTEMYNQGVSQYSESVDNMPNQLSAKVDQTVKTQHFGLDAVTDNVSQNILAQADQNSSLTNHNSMSRLDRTEFEGGLNTSRNSTPMGGGQYS